MYIPEKREAIELFIRDMSFYGNKLYNFFICPYYKLNGKNREI